MTKKQKVLLHVPLEMIEMVNKIKEKKVFISNSAVWFQALREYNDAVFKDYLEEKRSRSEKKTLTPMDRVKRKEDEKEAKKQLIIDKKLDIVKRLGGRVVDYGRNNRTAQWYTYHSRGKDMQEMSLELLTEDLVDNQFHGERAEIEKYQKVVPMKPLKPEEAAKIIKEHEDSTR